MPSQEILLQYHKRIKKKAAEIKALFFDVDGVLTDGRIIYDNNGNETKNFHVKDGYIISHLKKAGIVVGIITGRNSKAVADRAAELQLDFCHQGVLDKYVVFKKLAEEYGIQEGEIAYLGDDINDLKVLTSCGLSACPRDTPSYIKERADLVTEAKGGRGALREVADLILDAKGIL
ncbi:MAG: 3-deoxy-manno-octulosonate-8-phosphatase, partial [Candidatus Nephrothrix sp. EaCA]